MNILNNWASSDNSLINRESSKLKHAWELVAERIGLNEYEIAKKYLSYIPKEYLWFTS